MSTAFHIDGRKYALLADASSQIHVSEKKLRSLIADGSIRSLSVGGQVYVDMVNLSEYVRAPKEVKEKKTPPSPKEVRPSPQMVSVPSVGRAPPAPLPMWVRENAPPSRFSRPTPRVSKAVLALSVLVVCGVFAAGVSMVQKGTYFTTASDTVLAAAGDAPIIDSFIEYLREVLGLTEPTLVENTTPVLDWPEIKPKVLPPSPVVATTTPTYAQPVSQPSPVKTTVTSLPPVVERIVERVTTVVSGVTREELDAELLNVSNTLSARISANTNAGQSAYAYTHNVWNEGLANALRIEFLDGLEVANFSIIGSATTTATNGINISNGCFAVNGTCITGSGGGGSSLFTDGGSTSYLTALTDNLAIGTSTAYAKLTVWGAGTDTGTLFELANSASTTIAKFLDNGTGYFLGNIGIGTTTPYAKLSLTDAVSTAQVAIAYDATRYTNLLTNSVGDLVIDPQGGDAFLNDDNLWVCTGGSCPSGNPTGTGNSIVENKIGIGTTTPDSKLVIETQDATTDFLRIASTTNQNLLVFDERGFLGIGTSTPTQQLSIANKLFVGNGSPADAGTATSTFLGDVLITGKLDVSTIDPVYTIDGVKYATYGHSTIGIKEEMTAKVTPRIFDEEKEMYVYAIDFEHASLGSDAWLFWQVTDFGEGWEHLVAVLSPSFDGRVFYEEDIENGRVLVYAEQPFPVSVRLVANRFDAARWPNVRPDQGGFPGLMPPSRK